MIATQPEPKPDKPTVTAKPHREIWQFSHADGWQSMPADHPLAGFPIPTVGDPRQPRLTPRMAEMLTEAGFRTSGMATATTGGVLTIHKAVSADSPHWFFAWGMLLNTRFRVLFRRLPDALAFFNQHRGADLEIAFRPIQQQQEAA